MSTASVVVNFSDGSGSDSRVSSISGRYSWVSSRSGTYKHVLGIGQAGTVKIPPSGWVAQVFLVPDPSLLFDTNNVSVSRH